MNASPGRCCSSTPMVSNRWLNLIWRVPLSVRCSCLRKLGSKPGNQPLCVIAWITTFASRNGERSSYIGSRGGSSSRANVGRITQRVFDGRLTFVSGELENLQVNLVGDRLAVA